MGARKNKNLGLYKESKISKPVCLIIQIASSNLLS
jgi:hypothetical protein